MCIISRLICRANTIPIKIPVAYILKHEGLRIMKTVFKKNKARGYTLPHFKIYEVTVIKTVWH